MSGRYLTSCKRCEEHFGTDDKRKRLCRICLLEERVEALEGEAAPQDTGEQDPGWDVDTPYGNASPSCKACGRYLQVGTLACPCGGGA